MGSRYDCAEIAARCREFCEANGLEEPRDHWEDMLTHPKEAHAEDEEEAEEASEAEAEPEAEALPEEALDSSQPRS